MFVVFLYMFVSADRLEDVSVRIEAKLYLGMLMQV